MYRVCSYIRCQKRMCFSSCYHPHFPLRGISACLSTQLSKRPTLFDRIKDAFAFISGPTWQQASLKPYLNVKLHRPPFAVATIPSVFVFWACFGLVSWHFVPPYAVVYWHSLISWTKVCDSVHICKCRPLTDDAVQDTLWTIMKARM